MTDQTLLLAAFAGWRLTHLLHAEDGPFGCFDTLRAALARAGFGAQLACFLCLSLVVSLPLALALASPGRALLAWPALSAAAILLERLIFPETLSPLPLHEELAETALPEGD